MQQVRGRGAILKDINDCHSHTITQHDGYLVRLFLDRLMILGQTIVLKDEPIGSRPVSNTEATIESSSRDVLRPAARSWIKGASRETASAIVRSCQSESSGTVTG